MRAAEEANVPKYKDRAVNRSQEDKTILQLAESHHKLNEDLQNTKVLKTDRTAKTEELHKVNEAIQARIEELLDKEEVEAAKSFKKNPKAFFAYADRSMKLKSSVGPLRVGKQYHYGEKKMAEILSPQYEGAYSKPLEDYSHISFRKATCEELEDIIFNEAGIERAIDDMKWDSAPGPDGISAFVLKEHKEAMKVPLYYMRRMSLDRGKSPDGVNQSVITPTFKGRSRSTPKDYRPVALTNHPTKIFERVLRKAMVDHSNPHREYQFSKYQS